MDGLGLKLKKKKEKIKHIKTVKITHFNNN